MDDRLSEHLIQGTEVIFRFDGDIAIRGGAHTDKIIGAVGCYGVIFGAMKFRNGRQHTGLTIRTARMKSASELERLNFAASVKTAAAIQGLALAKPVHGMVVDNPKKS